MSSSHRILYVIDSLDRFGLTQQLDLLSHDLCQTHEVHIAVLGGAAEPLDCSANGDDWRTTHFLGSHDSFPISNRLLIRAGLRLRKLIRHLQPNILHAWGHSAERVMLAGSSQESSIRKFATELALRPSTHMTAEAFDQWLGKSTTQYIVPHEEVKKSLISHQYPAEKISIVPNAIGSVSNVLDARNKLVQIIGAGDHVRIAGAVAPLVPRSRLKDLVWATDLLTCIRNDFHFFIFGRGSQRQRLEKFASQTEAGDHVHFIDSERHGMKLLSGLDYFWQSHLNEPLPTAMTYAMSSGIPTVSVFGPGTTELITHQETGFAANFGARDEFARWTKYLLEKTEAGQQLARQGKESLAGKFSVNEMTNGYLAVYESS